VTTFVCVLIAGPAVLTALRRAARKANFAAPVEFASTMGGSGTAAVPNPPIVEGQAG
jgi:energy-coupling factor transport system substrate-specific component